MTRRLRLLRAARWIGAGLGIVMVLVVVLLVGLMTLTPAARFAVGMGLSRSPIPVRVGSVDGALRGPLVLGDVEVEQDGATVRIERVVLDWRPLALVGRAVEVDSLHVDGVTVFVPEGWAPPRSDEPPPPDSVSGPPSVPVLPVAVRIASLRLRLDRLEVEGTAEVRDLELTASGSPEELAAELALAAAADPVEQLEARATFAGSPDAYRLEATTEFTSAGLPPVRARIGTQGSLVALTVDSARVDTEHGFAALTAAVAWYPEVTWRVDALGDLLDIAPLTPDPESWPGQLSFRAHSEGRLAEAGVVASAVIEDLSGTLRDEPLEGSLDAEVAMPRIDVSELSLRWGEIDVEASGAVLDTADFRFSIDVPDLGQLRPGAAGRFRADGDLTGTRERPRVVAELGGDSIAVDSLAVGRVTATIDVDLHDDGVNRIEARLERLASGARVVDSVTVSVHGPRADHELGLGLWMPEVGVGLGAVGALSLPEAESGASWAGRLDALELDTRDAGVWRLSEAVALYAAADSILLERACLLQGPTGFCATLTRDRSGAVDGEASIDGLPLAAFPLELPEGMALEGRVDGSAVFHLAADGTVRSDGGLTIEGRMAAPAGADTARFAFGGDGLSFVVDSLGGRADFVLALDEEGGDGRFEVSAGVRLPGFGSLADSLPAQAVEGEAEVSSDDLSFLGAFVPAISGLGGRFVLDSELGGTIGAPTVRGVARLEDGTADVAAAGLQLRDIELSVEGDQEREVSISGSMRSGEGSFALEGRSPVEPSPDDPARLRLTGERFLAVGTPEVRVEVEPDLEIGYDGTLISVAGRVAVPWARIELLEVPEAAVPASADVVIVDEEPIVPPQVDARVEVVVGDDVRFTGLGFSSLIEGEVRVREIPGTPPTVLGELRFVDGSYRAYGQNLVIDPGRIIFAGQPEDAALDVTASRTAGDGTVAGLHVTGPTGAPEVELTSDPAMSDVDVLSYILYGHPLSDDASEQGQVAGAAATLGANVITTRLASQVGLDDARIEGTTQEQAQLVAGKYLTPSVYVSYGVGLFKPSNTFRIKYLLNSNWALQAESGDASGGDILYQIERGR